MPIEEHVQDRHPRSLVSRDRTIDGMRREGDGLWHSTTLRLCPGWRRERSLAGVDPILTNFVGYFNRSRLRGRQGCRSAPIGRLRPASKAMRRDRSSRSNVVGVWRGAERRVSPNADRASRGGPPGGSTDKRRCHGGSASLVGDLASKGPRSSRPTTARRRADQTASRTGRSCRSWRQSRRAASRRTAARRGPGEGSSPAWAEGRSAPCKRADGRVQA